MCAGLGIDHRAHTDADIADRAALRYSFATLLLTAFVAFSGWPAWVNPTAAVVVVVVFFFVSAVGSYILPGALRDTTNQTGPNSLSPASMHKIALRGHRACDFAHARGGEDHATTTMPSSSL